MMCSNEAKLFFVVLLPMRMLHLAPKIYTITYPTECQANLALRVTNSPGYYVDIYFSTSLSYDYYLSSVIFTLYESTSSH